MEQVKLSLHRIDVNDYHWLFAVFPLLCLSSTPLFSVSFLYFSLVSPLPPLLLSFPYFSLPPSLPLSDHVFLIFLLSLSSPISPLLRFSYHALILLYLDPRKPPPTSRYDLTGLDPHELSIIPEMDTPTHLTAADESALLHSLNQNANARTKTPYVLRCIQLLLHLHCHYRVCSNG